MYMRLRRQGRTPCANRWRYDEATICKRIVPVGKEARFVPTFPGTAFARDAAAASSDGAQTIWSACQLRRLPLLYYLSQRASLGFGVALVTFSEE